MSRTTHFLNLYNWYIHLLCTSPTRSIHFHVFDNITSNPDNVHDILKTRRLSFDIIFKFSFEIDTEHLRPRIQAISTTSNVVVAAHMETKAIIEHWFGEEAEGSDQSGGQCGHGDDRAEEEGDCNDDDGS
ncbi:hypothetical protein AHAS_Ahas05G0253900 [Arachis hypogaea]